MRRAAFVVIGALSACHFAGHGKLDPDASSGGDDDDGPPSQIDAEIDGDATMIDAFVFLDAPAFDPTTGCPGYAMVIGQTSRYAMKINGKRSWEQAADCAADIPGKTHLVTIDDAAEMLALQTFINTYPSGFASDKVWIGAVQPQGAGDVKDGWLGFDGDPLIDSWNTNSEPDDGDNTENMTEQFVSLAKNLVGMIDYPGDFIHGGLCECDGKPVPANVTTAVTANMF